MGDFRIYRYSGYASLVKVHTRKHKHKHEHYLDALSTARAIIEESHSDVNMQLIITQTKGLTSKIVRILPNKDLYDK